MSDLIIERSEFKGKPVLVLKKSEDDKYPFTFGLGKAKLILQAIPEIEQFVQDNQTEG